METCFNQRSTRAVSDITQWSNNHWESSLLNRPWAIFILILICFLSVQNLELAIFDNRECAEGLHWLALPHVNREIHFSLTHSDDVFACMAHRDRVNTS